MLVWLPRLPALVMAVVAADANIVCLFLILPLLPCKNGSADRRRAQNSEDGANRPRGQGHAVRQAQCAQLAIARKTGQVWLLL